MQCGFCTPGLVVAAADLLRRQPGPDRRRDPRGALREPLPLHRVPEDPRRGAPGGRAMSAPARTVRAARARRGDAGHAPRTTACRRSRASSRTRATSRRPGCSGATRCEARTRTRASLAIDTSEAARMPGVHAVLTHDDVPGQKTYGLEFPDQPVLADDRVRYFGEAVAIVAAEEPEQARRAAEAVRVEYEPLEPIVDPERATESEPLHPARDDRAARLPRRPAAERRPRARHPPRRPGRGRRRHRVRRLRARPAGPGVPRPRVRARDPGRRGRRRHPRRDAVDARRPRPGRAVPRPRAGAGADPPRRRRRRVRRARGPLDPDARGDARAAHGPAREDGLQPRGVVRRPHPPPPGADLGRAPGDARRGSSSPSGCGSSSTAARTRRAPRP